jgi:uncharacterized phiE125 gp8 family phage protein
MPNPVYEVVSELCDLPMDLDLVKKHLRRPYAFTSDDYYISQIIQAVPDFFTCRTNTPLLTTTYRLYLDCFPSGDAPIEVRRKPKVAITSIEYLKDNALIAVTSTDYYLTVSNTYPEICLIEGADWPTDVDIRKQAVQVNFTAGYGPTFDTVPSKLQMAIMQHVTNMYENRGDCSDCSKLMPDSVRAIYDSYMVNDIAIGC